MCNDELMIIMGGVLLCYKAKVSNNQAQFRELVLLFLGEVVYIKKYLLFYLYPLL